MNTVKLHHPSGASAEISQYGAHVLSWKTGEGKERLFLSERAEFKSGVAIRGGVPIVFPQFAGLGPLPKHGFARTSDWLVADISDEKSVSFTLGHSAQTMQIWPFKFSALFKVTLEAESLRMQLTIKNEDAQRFSFTAALHTYLRVFDIETAAVHGLQGVRYRDSTQNGIEIVEQNDPMHIVGEVDRIYMSTTVPIKVADTDNTVLCLAEGFHDTVIWNPGQVLSAKLADMNDDGYRTMLCVEAGVVAAPTRLEPGTQWCGEQRLQVIK